MIRKILMSPATAVMGALLPAECVLLASAHYRLAPEWGVTFYGIVLVGFIFGAITLQIRAHDRER